ncbi:ATP-binding protein [Fulvivirgaceae bacterium BMA10]|uniref:histidine kinase n=1 Tax=Splendidivirga corallicola TaxID=3051826 RepID=A0ABT8KZ18_9BACT|nr:ATP-binding protein [Fulvivirgaceae bacterium BMA10]
MKFGNIATIKWIVIFLLLLELSHQSIAKHIILSPAQVKTIPTEDNIHKPENTNLDTLDSIKSIEAFYAFIKSLEMEKVHDTIKEKLDLKLYQLVNETEDSLTKQVPEVLNGRIRDSSSVKSDIILLIDRALKEEKDLVMLILEFEKKLEIMNKKFSQEAGDLTAQEKTKILTDLETLEKALILNEKKFLQNQAGYKITLDSLKKELHDIDVLEDQLTYSERQRLKDQKAFQMKILAVLLIVTGLGLLTLFSIFLARKFRKQQIALAKANEEIRSINEHLEDLVAQKTESLRATNEELDTFLYKSSHDLKRPLTSIIGLSNIAKLTLDNKSWELFEKTSQTAIDMDRMLQKLMMVSQINHPSDYSNVDFNTQIQKVKQHFHDFIEKHKISFNFKVSKESSIDSIPTLVEIILKNLVENALFYCSLEDGIQPEVGVKIRRENSHIAMSIRDNGVGIKSNVQHKIWEMFFVGNENSRGNGLGLYIAQKAAKALNGVISFTTKENIFTEFKVILPIVQHEDATSVVK